QVDLAPPELRAAALPVGHDEDQLAAAPFVVYRDHLDRAAARLGPALDRLGVQGVPEAVHGQLATDHEQVAGRVDVAQVLGAVRSGRSRLYRPVGTQVPLHHRRRIEPDLAGLPGR